MKRRTKRLAIVAGIAGLMAVGVFAFTASNTVPGTKAGDGSGAITGYVVSSVHYTLNGSDPTKVDSVSFTLDSAPVAGSTLKVQLESAGSWYSCTNVTTAVTCATTSPQATVQPADNLRVIVAQ